MAKRGGAVVIRTAAPAFDQEKKLRPVYDALESLNPKAALKLLVGFIGKYGRLPILLALQALSLQRTGKTSEALELVRELLAQEPTDTTVMSPMTLVLQALNLPKEITLMYENALKKSPKNQEFMMQLFTAFGREHNFQRQQQIAMQLYTNSKELKFLFWSAVCWLLQIGAPESTVTPPSSMQFLHLAYMMIMREAPKDTTMLSEQCRLVVRLLARQGKVKEAIDIVHGPYGKELYQDDIERRRLLVELHSKLENWTTVRDIYLDLLSGENPQPSDWHYLCEWIRGELRLVKAGSGDESKIETLLASLQKQELDKPPPQRGPFLASCELYFALEPSEKRNSKLIQSLIAYCELFGTKSCWFDDIRVYLQALDPAGIQQICDKMQDLITKSTQPATQCYLQTNLQQILVSFTQITKKEETAKAMFAHYVSSLACATGSLEPTERGIGDVFLQLTCSILLDLYKSSKDKRFLIDAVLALEYGLERSRFNFQFKLLLVRLYSELGCMRRAIQIYESLSVKQIQLDSMSHVMLHDAIRYGYWEDAHDLCSQVLQFHVQYGIEEQDTLSRAFRANNFTKVLEFEELRLRLAKSSQAALCGAELRHLNMLLGHTSQSQGPICTDVNTLQCNQDYSVILSWHPSASQPFWDAVLNRPPPAVAASSLELPFDEPLIKTAEGYGLGTYMKSYIELCGLIEKQLSAVSERKIEVLQQSSEVLNLLEKMRLVDNSDSFRCRQWRLGLHCFETSRVLAEALLQSSGSEENEAGANWEAVLASFEELSRHLSLVAANLTLESATIPDVCMFLSCGGLWLAVCLQAWADHLPKKKGKKAKASATQAVVEKLSGLVESTLGCYRNLHSQAEKLLTEPDLLPRDPFPAAKLAAELEPEEKEESKVEVPDIAFTHESLLAIPKSNVNLFFVRMKASNRGSFESISAAAARTIGMLTHR